MNNGIFIMAHAPLASALRQCVLHVFPEVCNTVAVLDVQPNTSTDETLAMAKIVMASLNTEHTLVLTDMFGATPCNVALRLIDGVRTRMVAGVNLPMLMRAVTYRHESLDALMARVLAGGSQGIMQVAVTAPQNQLRKANDQNYNDHQQ
ncbi:PTS sugar transporter subunit IIA [Rhodoferax sp.]|uniref:PTS sugar transporter subunit IIA n=1 Tax=Rhodoferax sp. TaxID=50421 RepID=UPI00260E6230|nr:PTS sugar transporter subunit IIA [Rhodoferax sp.]MDD2809604.1 PTS sugar transporter subunit IIA [Rhodoferax sp.]MDD4944245.1 PTS sugar transporter subunit IIA [Rhodoferax sp.]